MWSKKKIQKKGKRNDAWVIIVFLVMIVAAVSMHFINKKQEKNIADKRALIETLDPSKNYAATLEAFQKAMEESLSQQTDDVSQENILRKTDLKHIKNNEIFGTLIERPQDGIFIFSADMKLEGLIQGYYYEVWLERQNPRHTLSLGPMKQDILGNYKLDFSSILDYKDYGKVFVSIEADNNDLSYSGDIVLRGDFK